MSGTRAVFPHAIVASKIETVVDVELGIALSQRWLFDDQLILRTELTDIGTSVDDDVFRYEAPPGVRVLVDPNPFAEAGVSAGTAAWQVAQRTTRFLVDATRWLGRGRAAGGRS